MRKTILVLLVVALALFVGLIVNVAAAGETGADQTGQFEKLKAAFQGKLCDLSWRVGASLSDRGRTEVTIKQFSVNPNNSAVIHAVVELQTFCPSGARDCIPNTVPVKREVTLKHNNGNWEFQYPRKSGGYMDFSMTPQTGELYGKRGDETAKSTCK